MTVTTSTALCTVAYCPRPSDPDYHRCFICGALEIQHHHVKPRGMGGSKSRKMDKKRVVPLCPPHHADVTEGRLTDDFKDTGKGMRYLAWDLHGKFVADEPLPWWEENDESISDAGRDEAAIDTTESGELRRAVRVQAVRDINSSDSPQADYSSLTLEDLARVREGPALTDDERRAIYLGGLKKTLAGFIERCWAVWDVKRCHPHKGSGAWIQQAYVIFENEGNPSRRILEQFARIFDIYLVHADKVDAFTALSDSKGLRRLVGRMTVEDGAETVETIEAHIAEYGEPPSTGELQKGTTERVQRYSVEELRKKEEAYCLDEVMCERLDDWSRGSQEIRWFLDWLAERSEFR